ncbi:NAD(P)-dependent malic enzyme [Haloplasma contractile]|uniref:Malate dehydrogenase protein n=1 Tax=Haloplasma contractile SSD-17B TaxID=1033810 RepID=F7PSZ3_9MOLU|nr:malic enzyme-like NAD(P)-binding protein [Haloplasma contractile]ERJ12595.1 malate dehydrogenase protein [Haloplasma contractile SSD-17B]
MGKEKVYEEALKLHEDNKGKLSIQSKVSVTNKEELSLAYSPGVAEPCRKIQENKEDVYKYTSKGNMVAVITDGSAVLGLGNIGPEASLPVMEGKSILLKEFANVDSFPLCLDTQDTEEIINTCKLLAPSLGGINLEDIKAPKCVEIERRLKEELDIPVFHDDQHGTAIVTTAALINACRLTGKKIEDLVVVVSGTGAAGSSIIKMLNDLGVKDIIPTNSKGIVHESKREKYNFLTHELLEIVNKGDKLGEDTLEYALEGADVFVGVSIAGLVTKEMVMKMNDNPFIFAMANPIPEIMPEDAIEAGATIIGTGRSDYPNQINNVLAFPGIFRGALDCHAKAINEEMKLAAAKAIAYLLEDDELESDYIIPSPFDNRVAKAVSEAVVKAAINTGVARIK